MSSDKTVQTIDKFVNVNRVVITYCIVILSLFIALYYVCIYTHMYICACVYMCYHYINECIV